MPKETGAVLLLMLVALGSRHVQGKGALALGFHSHRRLRNCRNVSLLPFLLELQLTRVTRACTEKAGPIERAGRNSLLREKRETQTLAREDSWLRDLCRLYLYCSTDHLISEGSCFLPTPMSLISIQTGTRTPLDRAVLRSEVLVLFVG